jgi:hypothetical protein
MMVQLLPLAFIFTKQKKTNSTWKTQREKEQLQRGNFVYF